MQRYLGRQSWNWDSCGLSETLFNRELRIFVNVVQLGQLRIVRDVVQLGAADFRKRCSIGTAADCQKRCSIGSCGFS